MARTARDGVSPTTANHATAPPGGERTRWGVVALVVGVGVIVAFQIGKVPTALPAIRAEFGLSLTDGAWVISIFNVLGLLLGMAGGAFGDQIGHRRAVVGALVAFAAASAVGGIADALWLLLATRVVEGMAFVVVVAAAPSVFLAYTGGRDQRLAFSFWAAYWPAGVAIMMLASPFVLTPFGWRGLWLANAAILIAYAGLLAIVTRPTAGDAPAARRIAIRPIAANMRATITAPGPVLLAALFGAYTVLHVTAISFMPTLLIERDALSGDRAALLAAIFTGVNVAGNLVAGILLHYGVARTRLIAATFLVMGASAFAIYAGTLDFSLRYAAALVFSGFGGIIPASIIVGVPIHAPRAVLVGTTIGLIQQGSQAGQFIGPLATAVAVEAAGRWSAAPGVLAVAAAIGIALAMALGALERRHRVAAS